MSVCSVVLNNVQKKVILVIHTPSKPNPIAPKRCVRSYYFFFMLPTVVYPDKSGHPACNSKLVRATN